MEGVPRVTEGCTLHAAPCGAPLHFRVIVFGLPVTTRLYIAVPPAGTEVDMGTLFWARMAKSPGATATPKPCSGIVCGLPGASSCTRIWPVRTPGPEGVNTTTNGPNVPFGGMVAGTGMGNEGVKVNSDPEIVALETFRG